MGIFEVFEHENMSKKEKVSCYIANCIVAIFTGACMVGLILFLAITVMGSMAVLVASEINYQKGIDTSNVVANSVYSVSDDVLLGVLGGMPAEVSRDEVDGILDVADMLINGVYNGGIRESGLVSGANVSEYKSHRLDRASGLYANNENYKASIDNYATCLYPDGTYILEMEVSCFGETFNLMSHLTYQYDESGAISGVEAYISGLDSLYGLQEEIEQYIAGDAGVDGNDYDYEVYTGVTDDTGEEMDFEASPKGDTYWED